MESHEHFKRLGDSKGWFGLVFLIMVSCLAYATYIRLSWTKRLSRDFSINLDRVDIIKATVNGKLMYEISSRERPVGVALILEQPAIVVTGKNFSLHVDLKKDGSFDRSSLRKGDRIHTDMDGDGDADLRISSDFAEESRELKIDEKWIPAPYRVVTKDDLHYRASWSNGWHLVPK